MRLRQLTILAALALVPASLPAAADGYRASYPYGAGFRGYGFSYPRVAYGTGFGQPFLQGDYVGAPFTSVPRPNHLVPTPWSYGTYGVPTVSGIAPAPTGRPTLTVIHSPSPRKVTKRSNPVPEESLADTQVINVSVPRR